MGITEQMYPHTLSAWRKVADGRSARWVPLRQMRCRWEGLRGATASLSGDVSADAMQIMIPSHSTTSPLLRGDRVALGAHMEPDPPEDALVVTAFAPYSVGSPEPDHWEVEAK